MPTLGAVLAGGQSSRFGSDKADALLEGRPLLAHALDALRRSCEGVVIVGRSSPLGVCVPDWPRPGMGPLGGLAGALRHAQATGYDRVLSVSVDSARLPADLLALLEPAPAYLASQPVIGLWPAAAAADVAAILTGEGKHSLRALAERTAARAVTSAAAPANINTPDDLAALEDRLRP